MARIELSLEQITEAQSGVDAEMLNLARVRKDYGDKFWAGFVGRLVVKNMLFAVHRKILSIEIGTMADLMLLELKPFTEQIKADPILAQSFAEGILSEMESRSFFREQLNRQV